MMGKGCGKQQGGFSGAQSSCCLGHALCLRLILRPLAAVYGLAVRVRTVLYEKGWLARRKLPCRVISVGNLTVGGTGKTPMVIWITERLLAQGLRVAVLSRGYRRQSREPFLLVSDGRTVLAGISDAGDEPHLIARRCPSAVVAVGADRYRLGRWVLERFPIDCLVLDDGFQH
ncbi:MAG: tetraacyldisaccharide 4'-kinase, partial [Nitrospira sp.]|nr:tetraacyldisaccharide 4'-kinase [Nitrospira sp.]